MHTPAGTSLPGYGALLGLQGLHRAAIGRRAQVQPGPAPELRLRPREARGLPKFPGDWQENIDLLTAVTKPGRGEDPPQGIAVVGIALPQLAIGEGEGEDELTGPRPYLQVAQELQRSIEGLNQRMSEQQDTIATLEMYYWSASSCP
mgnify:CR=1 FL=1